MTDAQWVPFGRLCITESMGRMFCTELPGGLETVLEKGCFFHCIAHLMNLCLRVRECTVFEQIIYVT